MEIENEQQTKPAVLVGVRFQPAGKPYHFTVPGTMTVRVDDWVVVETVYGEQVGRIVCALSEFPEGVSPKKLKPLLRLTTGLDMARYYVMLERSKRLLEVGKEETRAHAPELKLFSAEFTLDGSNALVMCTGNASKKQLATLRRRLVSRMNCRIELHSVGPRDHAKVLQGYGVCGEERCCGRFLTEFQAVSIRMAKDQTISMAPTDITGMCGRLRCCLAYEHEVYLEEAKLLPRLKARVRTEKGIGRVIDLDILKGDIIVEIPPDGPRVERQRFRFAANEVQIVAQPGAPMPSAAEAEDDDVDAIPESE
jgi:cell fate regulator YaaT (PSP1 superfamily)